MGWEPLAESDPVPGDPDAVRASARRLERLGDELGDQAGVVKRIDPGPLWLGLAAERFAEHRDQVPPALESAAARCYRSASALVAYAGELDHAQDDAAAALRRARHASGHIDDANQGLAARARHDRDEAEDATRWNEANPDRAPREPAPWSGPDWASALADAEAEAEEARRLLEDAVDRRDRAGRAAAGDLAVARSDDLADPWISGIGAWLGRIAGGMVEGLWAPGGQELSFLVTDAGLILDSKESWQFEALHQAGIHAEAWDPALGLAAIDAQVRAGWEYYARLYASDPERFLWAGMAKLAGASVYAGLQDLHVLRRAIQAGALNAEEVTEALRRLGLPFDDIGELTSQDLTTVAEELRFVETRLLEMQQNIFDDLAWQHVAYRQGGLAAMEGLYRRGRYWTPTSRPGATSTREIRPSFGGALWASCATSSTRSSATTTTRSATTARWRGPSPWACPSWPTAPSPMVTRSAKRCPTRCVRRCWTPPTGCPFCPAGCPGTRSISTLPTASGAPWPNCPSTT